MKNTIVIKKPFNISSEVEWLDLKLLIAEYANKRPHICSMVHKLKTNQDYIVIRVC